MMNCDGIHDLRHSQSQFKAMIVDALTHILPRYFIENRDEAAVRDHTFRELFANPKARIVQAEQLLEEMDRSEVDRSVIAGFGWTDQELACRSNDYNLESAARYSGKLIPVCSVNPIWEGDAAALEAERCLNAGAVGIGELHADTQGWVDEPYGILGELMSVVRKHDAVVTVHASEPVGHTYPGKGTMSPEKLLNLAKAYPDNRFVLSHFGGGLPFYVQMPEVRDALKNVWFDSAASPFLYDSSVYASAVDAVGASRVMFASDFPLLSQRRALKHLRNGGLDVEDEKIVSASAGELYDFSRLTQNQ